MSGARKIVKTHTLCEPIENGSETITKLEFVKLKAKHLKQFPAEAATFGDVLALLGRLCDQPPHVMDELDAEDLMEVSKIIGNFMPAGAKTGGKRSR